MKNLLLSMAAVVCAAVAATSTAYAYTRGQTASDQNIRYTSAYLEQANDMLSHDRTDYGGHRAAAVRDIATARSDLAAAMRCDRIAEDSALPRVSVPEPMDDRDRAWERNQRHSNQNIALTRRDVEKAIDMLQHDRHDYCGNRVRAIDALQAALNQLTAALAYR